VGIGEKWQEFRKSLDHCMFYWIKNAQNYPKKVDKGYFLGFNG